MSMYGRDPGGGPLEINAADSATDDDRSRNLQNFNKAALSRPLDETQQSWLLGPGEQKKKKYVDLGCIIVSRKIFVWTVGTLVVSAFLAGFITLIVKTVPRHRHAHPPPDNYTLALHKALMFFNAQKCKKISLQGDGVVGVYHPLNDEMLMKTLHGRNKEVYAWTVDDVDSMQKMLFERLDAVVTSNPILLQSLMQDIRTQCLEDGFSLSQ